MIKRLIGISCFILLIFISGLFLGYYFGIHRQRLPLHTVGMRGQPGRPGHSGPQLPRPEKLERLKRKLELSEEQFIQVKNIINKRHDEFRALQETFEPRVQEFMQQTSQEIRAVLTPEQQKKFDTIIKNKFNARHKKEKKKGRWYRKKQP